MRVAGTELMTMEDVMKQTDSRYARNGSIKMLVFKGRSRLRTTWCFGFGYLTEWWYYSLR
jgi:hypothetical protein